MGTESNGNGQSTALTRVGDVAPAGGAMAKRDEWNKLAFEPSSLDAAIIVATRLFKSGLLPSSVKSAEAALAIIMFGRERNLTAMQSLTTIYIVEGKPAMSSDLMAAKVLESGLAEYFEFAESTPEKCTFVTRRKGRPERSITWTIEQARQAGVVGKDVWKKYPAAMLRHRAASDLARAIYPEVVLGLYDPDEIEPSATPPPNPEAARAAEVMLHADIAKIRTEVETAARDMSPAMFERITGASVEKLKSGPMSGIRAAHEKLTSAGAFRAPEPSVPAPVIIEAEVVRAEPAKAGPAPKTVEIKVVPTTNSTQETGANANQSPDPAHDEPADGDASDSASGAGEEEAQDYDSETGVVEPQAPAEVEVTVAMLSAANTAARKSNVDKAVEVWKRHCAGRNPKDLTNPERAALLRELGTIGGGS